MKDMFRNIKNVKNQYRRHENASKKGFTLVELCVVLALIGIFFTMAASFSILMKNFVWETQIKYDFSKDSAVFKDALCKWIAENDVPTCVISTDENGMLAVSVDGEEKSVRFTDGVLSLGEEQEILLGSVSGITFTSRGKLIKCEVYGVGKNGERLENAFVFSLRSGRFSTEVIGGV